MSSGDALTLTGGKQLQREIEKLEKKAGEKLLKKAVRVAWNITLKAIRREAPADRGHLKKQTKLSVKVLRKIGFVSAMIGVKRRKLADGANPAVYQHLVTGGTQAHDIVGPVAFSGSVYSRVRHRGAKPNRYVDRGFDRSLRAANNELYRFLQKEIILDKG